MLLRYKLASHLTVFIVYGQNGLSLKKYWQEDGFPRTYKTVSVNQFPNLFHLLGPGSGLGHNSVVIMVEWYERVCLSNRLINEENADMCPIAKSTT